jgi:hypothetical protein
LESRRAPAPVLASRYRKINFASLYGPAIWLVMSLLVIPILLDSVRWTLPVCRLADRAVSDAAQSMNRAQFFVTGADALLFASFSSLILFVLSTLP